MTTGLRPGRRHGALSQACSGSSCRRRLLVAAVRQQPVTPGMDSVGTTVDRVERCGDNLELEQLGDNAIRISGQYLDARAGVFYVKGAAFVRVATYGVPERPTCPRPSLPRRRPAGTSGRRQANDSAERRARGISHRRVRPRPQQSAESDHLSRQPRTRRSTACSSSVSSTEPRTGAGTAHPTERAVGMEIRASTTASDFRTCWKRRSDRPRSCRPRAKSCASRTRSSRSRAVP